MAGVARSGFQALANAVWSLVTLGSRTVTLQQWKGGTPADLNGSGHVLGDVRSWNSSTIAAPNVAGRPVVDLTHVVGAALNTALAQLGINAVEWKSGAIPAPNVTGVPLIDLTYARGNLVNAPQAGRIDAHLGSRAAGMLGWIVDHYEAAIPFTASSQQQNVTITATTSAAAWVQLDGGHNDDIARHRFINSTTVEFTSRSSASPGTITAYFTVIQGPE